LDEVKWRAEPGTEDGLLEKSLTTEIKSVDEEARTAAFVISTDTVDRYNDTVSVDGWDLDNFKANPVVLWGHDGRVPAIGKALSVSVEEGKLRAVAQFASHPMANTVFDLIKGGFLNATSVGFFPKKWAYDEERDGYDFLEQELFEFSVVNVPANPEAVLEAVQRGIDLEPIAMWAEETLKAYKPEGSVMLWIPEEVVEDVTEFILDKAEVEDVGADDGPEPDPTEDAVLTSVIEVVVPGLDELLTEVQALRKEIEVPDEPVVEEVVLMLDDPDPTEDDTTVTVDADEVADVVREQIGHALMMRTGRLPKEV
jgi:HK97 family phage prohead protease